MRDGLSIDRDQWTARVGDRRLDLTYREFELLDHFMAHPFQVLSRRQLLDAVWGQSDILSARTVDVHVARLRRKLGPDLRSTITTVRQVGYVFKPSAGVL
ncbi:winged helix-turn-helix domain-containing protein [Streptacidiphilus sp. MAP12-16]|uniref:winged helix-turn-helix domain-containing protein n=1 Tax=Streptacidiphilus sp. MAP12-16 TaxID=3156300 RepID=UPI0035169A11